MNATERFLHRASRMYVTAGTQKRSWLRTSLVERDRAGQEGVGVNVGVGANASASVSVGEVVDAARTRSSGCEAEATPSRGDSAWC